MKKSNQYKSGFSIIIASAIFALFSAGYPQQNNMALASHSYVARALSPALPVNNESGAIKIALLLDTSGSMSGLIEQAKSQLWKIVNQLAMAKKGDQYANVEIALYEYGNSRLSANDAYVRQVVGLTSDLDEISKQLFSLSTSGGDEYCGEVIQKSIQDLDWDSSAQGLQVIFVAGNEPFDQGRFPYATACHNAQKSDIIVNTIFCGDQEEGVRTNWKDGADRTEGFYGSISMNEATMYVETPYDDQITALNAKLNETYIAFGSRKEYYSMNQALQDDNSKSYGKGNVVERTISKSSHVYDNSAWDMVDAKKKGNFKVAEVKEEELPDEMKGMTTVEKEKYISQKEADRAAIQKEIQTLNAKRTAYMDQQAGTNEGNGLDKAMINAIKKQAMRKNFTFDEMTLENISPDLPAAVDYPGFQLITDEVSAYRQSRLIDIATFNVYSKKSKTIILDTRSKANYDEIHLKGAIHLNFSEFTTQKLAKVIPDMNTRILIYCNNNFITEMQALTSKSMPLALNIPTFINLYGYGYKNIYELTDYLPLQDPRLEWEGTAIN
ncbi:VWA domain-containing protein [Crocinitomix sp.]|nr:VWA domain-containing protein [Crocinitomix sp.]